MIGDPYYTTNKIYVEVNSHGTLEELPCVGFWPQVWIGIRQNFKRWTVVEIRSFCKKHDVSLV